MAYLKDSYEVHRFTYFHILPWLAYIKVHWFSVTRHFSFLREWRLRRKYSLIENGFLSSLPWLKLKQIQSKLSKGSEIMTVFTSQAVSVLSMGVRAPLKFSWVLPAAHTPRRLILHRGIGPLLARNTFWMFLLSSTPPAKWHLQDAASRSVWPQTRSPGCFRFHRHRNISSCCTYFRKVANQVAALDIILR